MFVKSLQCQQSPSSCLHWHKQSAMYRLPHLQRVHSLTLNSAARLTANWLMQARRSRESAGHQHTAGTASAVASAVLHRWTGCSTAARDEFCPYRVFDVGPAVPNGLSIWFNSRPPVGTSVTVCITTGYSEHLSLWKSEQKTAIYDRTQLQWIINRHHKALCVLCSPISTDRSRLTSQYLLVCRNNKIAESSLPCTSNSDSPKYHGTRCVWMLCGL